MPPEQSESPTKQPELFSDHLMPTGWELLLTRQEKEATGRYTLERIKEDEEKVAAIIHALGAGFSARDICRAMHVHHRVVAGILGQFQESIDALKQQSGRKMLRTSQLCVDFFREELLAGNVSARDASIAAGIFSDKGLLFAGEANLIVAAPERKGRTLEELNRYIASLPALEVESDVKPEKPQ